ncbi:MAG TPA: thioredoxin family protein [Thioalkalivibrio sp.]|nr:thioredoxin family protein [Thioalkalivibrio sp.]
MKTLFRALFVLIALLGAVTWAQSDSQDAEGDLLREITDLRAEAAHGKPILVEFALSSCPYCQVVEEEFLEPMIRSGAYEDKVLIRKLTLGRNTIIDFDGREVRAHDLAARYGARMAPTVVVISPEGEQLSRPVVGLKTVDFYGGYLDRAIDEAMEAMAAQGEAELAAVR